jgi:SAM-dependent methyltransferase
MSDRLRNPIDYIRARGLDAYLDNLAIELDRRAPWARPALKLVGLSRRTLPRRERMASAWLRGEGLEIGAQATPLRVPPSVRVRYVDHVSREENLRRFPSLDAATLVEPDYLADGCTLEGIADASQDFVIANHVLEHAPDPIGALRNWLRVLRPRAILFAAVPIAALCFDRHRPLTTLTHMIEDHEVAVRDGMAALAQRNRAHYDEWLRIGEPEARREEGLALIPADQIPARVDQMVIERSEIHFHTFSRDSYVALLEHVGGRSGSTAEVMEVVSSGNEVIAIVRRR